MPFRPLRRQCRRAALNTECLEIIHKLEQTLDDLFEELRKRGGNVAEIRDMKRRMMRKNFQYYECLFKISATFIIHCQLDVALASKLLEAWETFHSYQYRIVYSEDFDEIITHFVQESDIPPQYSSLNAYVRSLFVLSKTAVDDLKSRKEQLEKDWERQKCNPQHAC